VRSEAQDRSRIGREKLLLTLEEEMFAAAEELRVVLPIPGSP